MDKECYLSFKLRKLFDYTPALRKARDLYNVLNWARRGYSLPLPAYLKRSIVRQVALDAGANCFVETGTYFGDTVAFCLNDFKKIISIELSHSFARAAVARFKNRSHIEIWEGDSGELLKNCSNGFGLCYSFWLDAHYQGISDTHKVNPILEELEVLLNLDIKIAVILIDDARCFGSTPIYPTIDEVKAVVAKYFPSASVVISEDILRVFL
jgi:hypothetical protein